MLKKIIAHNSIDLLPDELMFAIFKLIPPDQLGMLPYVCKHWRQLCSKLICTLEINFEKSNYYLNPIYFPMIRTINITGQPSATSHISEEPPLQLAHALPLDSQHENYQYPILKAAE